MSTLTESLVTEFDNFLGNKSYITPAQLIEIGLWGSASAAATALKRGDIPFIKISPKRTIIPKSAVLDYFRKNLSPNKIIFD
jgi:hypothetical protein